MNGQNLTPTSVGQSVELDDSMFTIYSEIEITDIPLGENIQFHIEYTHLDFEIPIDQPWILDINVPSERIAETSETIQLKQDIVLGNNQSVDVEKLVLTSILTVFYYTWSEEANHIAFKIVRESETEIPFHSDSIDPVASSIRYKPWI
ncbi:hypothetical protein JFL43_09100 [Viridibacillus sp. YIM B01967]|uniref:Uncharacterized protein n=1 Tax=Viridibacillus soli TaxID=2798301 RepID=A0ABS1H6T9_9BACL|nr:hypothetical protein [Viridibacillus soli]MBK3495014.1 hypothetical protein [Viridibacillus soli]